VCELEKEKPGYVFDQLSEDKRLNQVIVTFVTY